MARENPGEKEPGGVSDVSPSSVETTSSNEDVTRDPASGASQSGGVPRDAGADNYSGGAQGVGQDH